MSVKALDILLYIRSVNPAEILDSVMVNSLLAIQTEKVLRSVGANSGSGGENQRGNHHSQGNTSHTGHTSHTSHTSHTGNSGSGNKFASKAGDVLKKPAFKKKVDSFDDAMKNKIVSDLNKISQQNYESVLKNIVGVYSRIADDERPWALRLIITNATRQHVFADLYVSLYRDIVKSSPEDKVTAEKILQEFLNQHKETILTELSNGDNYDEFCEANKVKTSRIGLSIFLAEASNINMIPPEIIGKHAAVLVDVLDTIRLNASTIPKESSENQVDCVLKFFTIVAKTKLSRSGFQICLKKINDLSETERKEKKLSPKGRFAIMGFVEDMFKKTKELQVSTPGGVATTSPPVSPVASSSSSTSLSGNLKATNSEEVFVDKRYSEEIIIGEKYRPKTSHPPSHKA
jgi:hypothetical protein